MMKTQHPPGRKAGPAGRARQQHSLSFVTGFKAFVAGALVQIHEPYRGSFAPSIAVFRGARLRVAVTSFRTGTLDEF